MNFEENDLNFGSLGPLEGALQRAWRNRSAVGKIAGRIIKSIRTQYAERDLNLKKAGRSFCDNVPEKWKKSNPKRDSFDILFCDPWKG